MILVILHKAEYNEYENGRLIEEKGQVYVSHGVNIDTGKTVILPSERWSIFKHNCTYIEGEWYLK